MLTLLCRPTCRTVGWRAVCSYSSWSAAGWFSRSFPAFLCRRQQLLGVRAALVVLEPAGVTVGICLECLGLGADFADALLAAPFPMHRRSFIAHKSSFGWLGSISGGIDCVAMLLQFVKKTA